MPKLREEAQIDVPQAEQRYSTFKNEQYPHEILCGSCSTVIYVDDATYESFHRAVAHDPDNQILCDNCLNEYEEEAHAAP